MMPLAVADTEQFKALTWGQQKFLFDLYVIFHDCERFTIDMSNPKEYRQMPGANLAKRINALVDVGLLEIVGTRKAGISSYQRVFAFPQPPDCQPAIAGSGLNT